jgi:hypothetical protein
MLVAVALELDREPGREIEIFLAILSVQIDTLAPDRPHLATWVNGHERRDGHRRNLLNCLAGRRVATPIARGAEKVKGAPVSTSAPLIGPERASA